MRAISHPGARLVTLKPSHAAIVPHLCEADMQEIRAATTARPEIAVALSVACSDPGWAVELEGRPLCVFGAGPAGTTPEGKRVGRPWLLSVEDLKGYPVHFLRVSRDVIAEMRRRYDVLENWVDARNLRSIKWLRWCGFEIMDAEPWGPFGAMFHRFYWEGGEQERCVLF